MLIGPASEKTSWFCPFEGKLVKHLNFKIIDCKAGAKFIAYTV